MAMRRGKWDHPTLKKEVPPEPMRSKEEIKNFTSEERIQFFSSVSNWNTTYNKAKYYSDEEIYRRYCDVTSDVEGWDNQFCDIICKNKKSMLMLKDAIIDLYSDQITYPDIVNNEEHFLFGIDWGGFKKSENGMYLKCSTDSGVDLYRIVCVSRSWEIMNKLIGGLMMVESMFKKKYITNVLWSD